MLCRLHFQSVELIHLVRSVHRWSSKFCGTSPCYKRKTAEKKDQQERSDPKSAIFIPVSQHRFPNKRRTGAN
jgi:hypothetical protein